MEREEFVEAVRKANSPSKGNAMTGDDARNWMAAQAG